MKLQFLGANRQVTGSSYVLEVGERRVMIDCGMFQEREFVKRNWDSPAVPPESIDTVLLTHAHLDHCGLLPRLVAAGFDGPIVTTFPSRDLAAIILEDAAEIQEEDAAYKLKRHRREGRKGPRPVVPLYKSEVVPPTLIRFRSVNYAEPVEVNEHVTAVFHDAGHILGSAMIQLDVRPPDGAPRTILFSGDIGQKDKPLIRDPTMFERADYVIMESTYGGRNHRRPDQGGSSGGQGDERLIDAGPGDIPDQLEVVIKDALDRGGNLIIPTFAVERAQELMFFIGELRRERRIPSIMVFLDSPMAVDVTDVFRRHRNYADEETTALLEAGRRPLRFPGMKLVRTRQESKEINRIRGTAIIMAGSGMCTAGRVKHHLVANIGRPESTVLFVGYQARGTLGQQILSGKQSVRIHGRSHRVRARVAQIHGLSAHADQAGLLEWIGHLKPAPRRVFLTHGEEDAATALAERIREQMDTPVEIPEYRSEYELE